MFLLFTQTDSIGQVWPFEHNNLLLCAKKII